MQLTYLLTYLHGSRMLKRSRINECEPWVKCLMWILNKCSFGLGVLHTVRRAVMKVQDDILDDDLTIVHEEIRKA